MTSGREPAFAVLLDIDGTLIDSNYLHVDAWSHAFQKLGLNVPAWRIHRAIGSDSSKLLDDLIGDAPDEVKHEAKHHNTEYFDALKPRLKTFDGARGFIADAADQGLRVVLATSAPSGELEKLLDVLDSEEHIYAVTSAEDVETAKPDPDVIAVALARADVDAEHAIMIGDSVWDVIAASKVGVPSIALLSGGTGRTELRNAGASAVFDDIADLHRHASGHALWKLLTGSPQGDPGSR